MDYIANTDLKVGALTLISADHVDVDHYLQHAGWSEQLVALLKEKEQIVPLTRERFQVAVVRRPGGAAWPPYGFTEAYLLAAGVIDPAAIPEPPAKRAATVNQPPLREATPITQVELTDGKIPVGPYFLQPRKVGNFTNYDVCDAEGRLLRPKPFRDQAKATAFLEELYTNPVGQAPAQEGDDDDRELQPEPGDGD